MARRGASGSSRGLVGPAMRPLAAAICAFGLLLAVTGSVMPRSTATPALANTGSAVTDQSVPAAEPGSSVQAGGLGAVATPAASPDENHSTQTGGPRPTAVGVAIGSPQPRPTPPEGAFGQPPSSGAGDLAGGAIPPTADKSAATLPALTRMTS